MKREKLQKYRATDPQRPLKSAYEKPVLLALGKVTSLTMGSKPGTGESGKPGLYARRTQ